MTDAAEASSPELVPVDHAGDPLAVGQDVRQVQVVVGEVSRRQPQPPHRPQPVADPLAQRPGLRAGARRVVPHLVPVIEQHVRDVAREVAVPGREAGPGLPFHQVKQGIGQRSGQRRDRVTRKPLLHRHVPLAAERTVPDELGNRIPAGTEKRQPGRAPARLLVGPVTVPDLDHDLARAPRAHRPGRACPPRRRQPPGAEHRLPEFPLEPRPYQRPIQRFTHLGAMVRGGIAI
jgi:hypothetical protein